MPANSLGGGSRTFFSSIVHKVEIIMVSHFFSYPIVDIVLKVITDSTPIIFIAIYSAITISLCLLAIRFPRRFHYK